MNEKKIKIQRYYHFNKYLDDAKWWRRICLVLFYGIFVIVKILYGWEVMFLLFFFNFSSQLLNGTSVIKMIRDLMKKDNID